MLAKPPSVKILMKEILNPDSKCDKNFDNMFELISIFGEGGGSYLIEAKSNKTVPSLGIVVNQSVAIKLCKGDILDIVGCNEYVKEANIMRKITLLNAHGICYNFPVYYMYGKCCMFYRKGQFNNIENNVKTRLSPVCDLPYDKFMYNLYGTKELLVPDLLIHYANDDIDIDNLLETENRYGKTCLNEIKSMFQLDNFKVLGKKWDSQSNSKIYEFIVGDNDVNCGNYIIMSKIEGLSLDKLGLGYSFGSDLVFEMMYSNACLIKYYGFVLGDRHDDNVIIANPVVPRIYKLGSYYLYFNTRTMYYSIDLQTVTDKKFSNIKDLITVGPNHINNEMKMIINTLYQSNYTLNQFMTEVIPVVYKNYQITHDQVSKILSEDPRIRVAEYK